MDKLVSDTSFELESIDKELQIELCFNILPMGRTILHLLSMGAGNQGKNLTD